MREDTIRIDDVEIPLKEYIILCKQAYEQKVKAFGEDVKPLRDYAFQEGYIRGVLSVKL